MFDEEQIKIIHNNILNENIDDKEKEFLLKYLSMNRKIEQTNFNTPNDYKLNLLNDLSYITDYLKSTSNRNHANKLVYSILKIYNEYLSVSETNIDNTIDKLIDLSYEIEKIKTECNIESHNVEIVCKSLNKRGK